MTEQIYIDEELMNVSFGTIHVQLIYNSPFLMDLSHITSNRTSSVTLPATAHNLRVIGNTGTQAESVWAYRKHSVRYCRDMVQLFKGTATLISVRENEITFCFTWGNSEAFKPLFDTQLNEIATTRVNEVYCQYKDFQNLQAKALNYSSLLDFGMNRNQPLLRVNTILSRIQSKCNVTGLQDTNYWKHYAVAMVGNKGDDETKEFQVLKYGTDPAIKFVSEGNAGGAGGVKSSLRIGMGTTDTQDLHEAFDADNYCVMINGAESVRVCLDFGMNFKMGQLTSQSIPFNIDVKKVRLCFGNSPYGDVATKYVDVCDLIAVQEGVAEGSYTIWQYRFNTQQTINATSDGCMYMWLEVAHCSRAILADTMKQIVNQTCTQFDIKPSGEEEVVYGTEYSSYPKFKNLPNISCGDFIKGLYAMRGMFAYADNDNAIRFVSIEEISANKAVAKDWTDKVLMRNGNVGERTTEIDGMCQKNWLRWNKDAYTEDYPASLDVDDETLDAERDYFVSDLALAKGNYVPVWTKDDDNKWHYQGDTMPCRIVYDASNLTTMQLFANNAKLNWENLLNENYTAMRALLEHPVVIKAEVIVNVADLAQLDMRVPIYLKQTGRYYLLHQLIVSNGMKGEATLIQL